MKSLILGLLALSITFSAFAEPKIYITEGTPEAAQYGYNGDLDVNKTGSAIYEKSGGYSNTGWIKLVNPSGHVAVILSGTADQGAPVTGSVVLTSTSAVFYLTGSTGLIVKSGTTITF